MQLTTELKEIIIELINSDNISDPLLKKVARQLNVLPIFTEMGGWYGLSLTGEIVSASWDEPFEVRIETDQRICNIALFEGTKKYPELSDLTPIRKETDEICSYCGGTGIHPLSSQINIGCYCGGLGWIPKPYID